MAAPFKDDSNERPNLAFDGIVPELLQLDPRRWRELEEFKRWTPPTYPTLPGPPLGSKPWWLDPSTSQTLPDPPPGSYPYWVNPPSSPTLPPPSHEVDPPKDPNSPITENQPGRAENAPTNWLLSYFHQNRDGQRGPINSAPARIDPATDAAPAESRDRLLGMFYEMMRQRLPKQELELVSNQQDPPEQAPPERRLGRRTCRA